MRTVSRRDADALGVRRPVRSVLVAGDHAPLLSPSLVTAGRLPRHSFGRATRLLVPFYARGRSARS